MKRLSTVAVLSLSLLVVACSDKNEKIATDAARFAVSAKTYKQQGQIKAAMLEARNIIQLQPEAAQGYALLASIYNDLGASTAVFKLLEPKVDSLPELSTELAQAYLNGKKYRTALNVISKHPASTPEDKLRQAKIAALSSIYLGEADETEKYISALKQMDGAEADVAVVSATALLSQGKSEAAMEILNNALQANPENLEILQLLGSVNVYSRNLEVAEKHLSKALGLLPKTDILTNQRLTVLTLMTETLIQLGRTSEAYTYQKVIAEANPDSSAAQQRFNEAMELFQQGKLDEAEAILRELREQFPNDKNSATLLGMVEFRKGADDKASTLFDEFIDPETATPTVLQAAALVKYRNNQMDDAIKLLKTASENQPNNATILATYGLALLDQDDKSAEGAKALEKSLAINPKQQRIRIALAKRYMALEQTEQAIAQLQKAYQEQPLDLVIQQTYLKLLFDNGAADRVKEEVASFKEKHPGNPRGDFIEGWYFVEEKNYAGAQEAFERAAAAKNNPEKQLAYSGLAQVYEQQNQLQKAAVNWQMAIEADPKMTAAYGRWMAIMQKLNRKDDAEKFLLDIEEKTSSWQASLLLSQLELQNNKIDKSISHVELALTRSNEATNVKQIAARLYQTRGVMLRNENKLPEARASFLQAVKLFPENAGFLYNLIEVELADKKVSEAQKLLDQFVKTDDNEAERLYLQANIKLAEQKNDEALTLFRTSWGVKPLEAVGEAIYATYQSQQKADLSESFAKEWAEKLPKSYRAALINAMTAQQKNDEAGALQWYEKTVELAPKMPAALNNLAWIYYEKKDERAEEIAKRAYELAPNNPAILDTYGWILVEKGKVEEGLEYLQRAATAAPDNQEILNHVNEAKKRK
ncbi:MAG TPA: tetratricopeptide repeat protein [Cellvibrio sp.]|nr:tetratricopeptide repeat protein [Cellvibrio sp.]